MKPILAKLSGVSFLLNFFVLVGLSPVVVVAMRTASTGEILEAILIGLWIERRTDHSVNKDIITIITNVFNQFHPLGTRTYPTMQPTIIPIGIDKSDNW